MSDTVQQMRTVLREAVDSTPAKASAFFKTGPGDYAQHDQFMGITVPTLRRLVPRFVPVPLADLSLLLQSAINEERLFALIVLTHKYSAAAAPQKEEIYQFYRAHRPHINNWNLVDSSAPLIVGAHLFGRDCAELSALACSSNLWERRIAVVATWYFIRHSELDWTYRIAKLLQNDRHDLIHKAVGWMLREAGKKDEGRLWAFLVHDALHMPKTMLRYAMERLSKEQQEVLSSLSKKRS